jgi:hypothetical protein
MRILGVYRNRGRGTEERPQPNSEESMESTADRAASDSLDRNNFPFVEADRSVDVPGKLAGRIGELYASEERRRRRERTDRLMQQAVESRQA